MAPTENQLNNFPAGMSLTREDVTSTMEEWAHTNPPSRFMIYGIIDPTSTVGYDGDVIAWGLCFNDHVYVQSVDSHVGGRFRSPKSMRRVLSHRYGDIHLVWVDPEPEFDQME